MREWLISQQSFINLLDKWSISEVRYLFASLDSNNTGAAGGFPAKDSAPTSAHSSFKTNQCSTSLPLVDHEGGGGGGGGERGIIFC